MVNKKYSSYVEIEHDLEILKVEKELYYQKMLLSFEKTKNKRGFQMDFSNKIKRLQFGSYLKIKEFLSIEWMLISNLNLVRRFI